MKKKKICVNGIDYEIIRNDSECFYDDIIEKITDYFIPYDYIVGDFYYCSFGANIFVLKKLK